MAVANFAFNLCFRNKRCYRVNHDEVNSPGTSKNVDNLKGLFACVWLRAKQVINIYTQFLSINRIKCMLRIDERASQTLTLSLSNYR